MFNSVNRQTRYGIWLTVFCLSNVLDANTLSANHLGSYARRNLQSSIEWRRHALRAEISRALFTFLCGLRVWPLRVVPWTNELTRTERIKERVED